MRALTIMGIVAVATSFACAQAPLDLDELLNPAAPAAPTNGNGTALEELMGNAAPGELEAVQPEQAVPGDPGQTALARQVEEMERVRREHAELKGRKTLSEAEALHEGGNFRDAITKYEEAIQALPDRPATAGLLSRARQRMAEATLAWARAEYDRENLSEARRLADLAKTRDESVNSLADRLITRVSRRQERLAAQAERGVPVHERPEIIGVQKAVQADYDEGVRLFAVEEYDRAEVAFESALLRDPYHRKSMRYLRAIQERRLAARETHRQVGIARMTDEVRSRWNPPIRQLARPAEALPEEGPDLSRDAIRAMRAKLESIIIPSLVFRDANIEDVINFLGEASRANDPDGVGVSFIMKLGQAGAAPVAAAPVAVDDPWAMPTTPVAAPTVGPAAATRNVTLSLRRISLLDAIKYITEITQLQYQVEEYAVVILPAGAAVGDMITRIYPVLPTISQLSVQVAETAPDFTAIGGGLISETTSMQRNDMLEMFKSFGVEFPQGASISYNVANSRLIAVNTTRNLEEIERILREINVVPSQVEIEARFVEVNQDDLEAFGFEWLLTDNWVLASKKGPGPVGTRERIQINANHTGVGNLGFSKGLRYFASSANHPVPVARADVTQNIMLGSLATISSVLTNPELTMVLHALEQRGGADLLSAPRIVTRSGNNAQIQVVQELLYPTEYIEQSLGIGTTTLFRPPIPSEFESRGVGVVLNVTPTVGPDGYTIDLTLVPEIAELVGWIDYSPQNWYPMDMPIFSSRNIQTSIVIWDGQTVVMGGLIRDRVVRMDDRIPLLGDLPLLGRLFRSKGEYSAKRNMMVFVTARMMDPTGQAIRDQKLSLMGGPSAASAQ